MIIINTINERIADALKAQNMTQLMLAREIDAKQSTVNHWIVMGTTIPATYIIPISKALNVHPIWLLTGEETLMPDIPESYTELAPDESYLITTYRSLDMEGRVMVSSKAVEELRRMSAESINESSSVTA